MGKKIRITRKSLKKDEVRSYWLQVLTWVQANRKSLLISAAAVVVLLLFTSAFRQRTTRQVTDANLLIARAQMEVQYAFLVEDDRAREKVLNAAEEKLEMVRQRYRRSGLVPYATFLLGNIAFSQNDYDEAEERYMEFLDDAHGSLEKADGYIALGYTYENRFFWGGRESVDRVWLERALESYREAEQLTTGTNTTQRYLAMMGRARLLDLEMERPDEAKRLYEQIARERRLDPPKYSAEVARGRNAWLFEYLERMRRLFTLAQTAQLRLDQMEASD